MKPNVGSTDRLIRYILGILFIIGIFMVAGSFWKILLGVLAVVMFFTATINFCPIWAALRINTHKKN